MAAVRAWASRSAGRCGASPVSAWARAESPVMAVAAASAVGQQVGGQVRGQLVSA